MGKLDNDDDGDLKVHPSIEEALREQGFCRELHWVLRQHVSDAPPIGDGAEARDGAQGASPNEGRSAQSEHRQRGEDTAQSRQTSDRRRSSGAKNTAHDNATSESAGDDDAPASDASRKTKQRERAAEKGWKEVTVKAPISQDARKLVSEFARAIFDIEIRELMRLAVANPKLIQLGQKIDSLGWFRRILVSLLLP